MLLCGEHGMKRELVALVMVFGGAERKELAKQNSCTGVQLMTSEFVLVPGIM